VSTSPHPRRRLAAALAVAVVGVSGLIGTAQAQDGTTTTTTVLPPGVPGLPTTTTTTTVSPGTAPPDTVAPSPEDPSAVEGVEAEPVPEVAATVPARPVTPGVPPATAARIIKQELSVAQADAVKLGTNYATVRAHAIALESQLDTLERSVTDLAEQDRAAVRRVAATKRYFDARAATAIVRGRIDDIAPSITSDDPNDVATANILLGSVLSADQAALQEYLAARTQVDANLVAMADRLVGTRNELSATRAHLVDARRANIAAQINLKFFTAGSPIVIQGFVFPVGTPNTFGDSFGAPRMVGTQYVHAHQGTDIMAPRGTPLLACERGIVSKMGTDVLGGTKLWLKGESGTYYYYAHLDSFAPGLANGQVVDAGQLLGYVGDTGNAKGGATHLHFEIHPDGKAAVNPYPLLKVVKQLNQEAGGQ
jgi:murein DD-endopeptidase MepM/ murein hydrolase activator NlpD